MFGISLTAAFLGGLLSFLAPCGAVILPSYFLYSFKERTRLLKATFIFWLGFLVLFLPFGLGISFLVRSLIIYRQELAWIGGALLIFFGILALGGKGLHLPGPRLYESGKKKDIPSLILLGAVFGFALLGCSAPILGSILTLSSLSPTKFQVVLLLLAYSFGLVLPLFILSLLAEKFDFAQSRLIRGKMFNLSFGQKSLAVHSTNLITAVLFITLGIIFIISRGTFYLTRLLQNTSLAQWYFKSSEKLILLNQKADLILLALLILGIAIFIYKKFNK